MIELRNTPWLRPSNDDQRTHAVLHAVKAAGKLAALLEEEGHDGFSADNWYNQQPKFAADLVICAIRLADVCAFDLEAAVRARQADKNTPPGS